MYDIAFVMDTFERFKDYESLGMLNGGRIHDEFEFLESKRSKTPVAMSVETTNDCPCRCFACPRTTKMTRAVFNMTDKVFERAIEDLRPHEQTLWEKWVDFCYKKYGVKETNSKKLPPMDENTFYLFVSSACLTLHGHGDPMMDMKLTSRIAMLTDKKIPTYFSTNPALINVERLAEMFESGLDFIKFSVDSVNNNDKVRGSAGRFSWNDIWRVKQMRDDNGYKTNIILTMINFSDKQDKECKEFLKIAPEYSDFAYIKSQDNRWLYKKQDAPEQKSIHWQEICKMPWVGLGVQSQGYVVSCHQIYNAEQVLGDLNHQSLQEIWDGEGYRRFRKAHLTLDEDIIPKCYRRCDMNLIGGRQY